MKTFESILFSIISVRMLLTLFTVSLVQGCASTAPSVIVRSNPDGAKVYALGFDNDSEALIGNTPLSFAKSTYSNESQIIQLRIEKEGFVPKETSIATYSHGTVYVDAKLSPITVAKKDVREAFEKVRILRERMNRLVKAKKYAEALTDAEEIISTDPKSYEGHAAKGSVLYLMKDFQAAKKSWQKALELNPSSDSVRSSLINLSLNTGKE